MLSTDEWLGIKKIMTFAIILNGFHRLKMQSFLIEEEANALLVLFSLWVPFKSMLNHFVEKHHHSTMHFKIIFLNSISINPSS